MFLHWREDAEVALNATVVVLANIILNHIDQFFFAGKAFAVVPFSLQDAPEAFHWPVINTLGHTRHTLRHACLLQLVMEDTIGILKTSVTMEQRMCIRIALYGTVKGLKNQRVVIATMPSILIKNGVDIATVSRRLGHKSINTTMGIYVHALKEADAQAVEAYSELIRGKKAV